MATKYVIIDASEVSSVDFSQVREDSADTVRYNLDNTKALVKFNGSTVPYRQNRIHSLTDKSNTTDASQGWYIADTQAYLDNN